MNILIITHFFPPLNEIASLRLYSFAKYWESEGNNIFVLTTTKIDLEGKTDLNLNTNRINISTVGYSNLIYLFKKKIIIRKFTNIQSIENRENSKLSLAGTILNKINKKNILGSLRDVQFFWIKNAYKEAVRLIDNNSIDVIFSSYSPGSVHILGKMLKDKYPEKLWVADFRDLWSRNPILKAKGIFRFVEKYIESNTLRHSDLIVTISVELARILKEQYPLKKIIVTENGYDDENMNLILNNYHKNITIKDKPILLTYSGTIYEKFRDPYPLLKAISILDKEKRITPEQIQLNIYGDRIGNLDSIIDLTNTHNYVVKKGYVKWDESIMAQQESDFLIFLDWNDIKSDGTLTGKFFEYVYSNKPIISIGANTNSIVNRIIRENKLGLIVGNDIELLKDFIIKAIIQQSIPFEYTPNFENLKKYSRRELALNLLKQIEQFRNGKLG